jgi:uncharacterized protein YkwD
MPGLTCRYCRKIIAAPAAVCPHCRKPIKRARQAPAPRVSRGLIAGLAGAGICMLLAVAIVAGYFFLGRNPPPEKPLANQGPAADDGKKLDGDDTPPLALRAAKDAENKKPAPAKKPAPPLSSERWVEQFVDALNRHRKTAGLANVTFDSELSNACLAHAKYLAQNAEPSVDEGPTVFVEDPAKSGYSVEGERAGQVASVAFAEPLAALERWMGKLVNRTMLLNPDVRSVGLGFAPNAKDAWITVLDAQRGRGEPMVLYPAPKQTDVPLSFSGGAEVPEPKAQAGFPITVVFPPGQAVTDGRIELRDDKGNEVAGWVWTPQKPVHAGFPHHALALIPKATLRSDCVYQVKASAQVAGKAWSLAWSFTTLDDADGKGIWRQKALAKVNHYRAQAGLKPVVLDDQLGRGCLAHARYMAINEGHPALQGLKAHDEDLSLPGASKEGDAAGKASDIATGDYEPTDAVDAWMATLYHRVPILEPNLHSIGFGCARGRRFGWVTVMNVGTGRDKGPRPHPVFYPAPDQVEVPLSFPIVGEEPNPIPDDEDGKAGYPVTAFFPHDAAPTKASGKLTDGVGKEIPCWFSSREKPANPSLNAGFQGTTICLIAKDPLQPNTTYHVHLQGELAGAPWDKKWQFTTGDAGATVAQASRHVVDRLNDYRAQAGLAPVVGDESLSSGCQAHAEYLVKHAERIQQTNASVNDEDPLLPGFTADGRRSAQRSDVFINAPIPVSQIDDLMAAFTRRVLLLDPTLQRIGFGCARDIGRGWRCVLDLNAGRGDARIVRYPAPDQDGVPCIGFDRLAADAGKPVGFPISVTFPKQARVRNVQAVLSLEGADVAVLISSPEKPLVAKSPGTTLGVYPLEPLQGGRTYTVIVSAIVDAAEWRQEWRFTTAAKGR